VQRLSWLVFVGSQPLPTRSILHSVLPVCVGGGWWGGGGGGGGGSRVVCGTLSGYIVGVTEGGS